MTARRVVALALVVAAVAAQGVHVESAAADGSGGATSRVVGRGDIVTSILSTAGRGGRQHSGAPRSCRWITFSDAQLEFLVAISTVEGRGPDQQAVFDALHSQLDREAFATSDLQGLDCDGVISGFRLVERAVTADLPTMLAREMITRLPAPVVVTSPPEGTAAPVGEPVFVSSPASAWQPIQTTLAADGIVAEVRATPVALRTFAGDPNSLIEQCNGPGRPFSASDPAGPRAQAGRSGSCVIEYHGATHHADGSPVAGRPAAWIGTVTVVWSAEWRIAPGPWRSLGLVPRTRLMRRDVREVETSLTSRVTTAGA